MTTDFDGDQAHDFVIIGSGAGGGLLAANLALEGYRVLLIEAGGDKINDNYSVPAFHRAPVKIQIPAGSSSRIIIQIPKTAIQSIKQKTTNIPNLRGYFILAPARLADARHTMR